MSGPADDQHPPSPPSVAFRQRLIGIADDLAQAGQEAPAAALRALVESWWAEEVAWMERIGRVLNIHHEINNALVGIRGNTQLLLMAPVAEQPKVRERLEVVLRESTRIKDAAASIRELRLGVAGPGTSAHAA